MLNEKRKNIILAVIKFLIFSLFVIFIVSCTPKKADLTKIEDKKDNSIASVPTQLTIEKTPEFNKELREAIYFSNSLEREALKLILKDSSLQKLTLFSVLSYVVETNSGAKKTTPFGLDCGKFDVIRENKIIKVFKSCVKPYTEMANIKTLNEGNSYELEFLIKEWANVVGLSVTLTGENVHCRLGLKEKKLYSLSCDNWSYQTQSDEISSTVVRAKEFLFQRDAQNQFVIKGGFFKELVENKKINIVVPLEGKIKIFEKEIRVIDEFVSKKNEETDKETIKEKIKPEENAEAAKEVGQETSQEGDGQEINQDTGQEGSQEVSSDTTRRGRGR